MKPTIGTLLAAAAVLGLATPAVAQERKSIKVGMTISSTGTFASASQSGERGVQIWVDDVNQRGGITMGGKKYPVELIKRDDRSDKQLVSRVYDSLINEEKADVLIAPFSSTLVGVAAPIADSNNRYMVSWAGSSDQLFQQGYKTVVSATVQASQIPVTSTQLMSKLGIKKMAIAYADDPFPASTAAAARDMAEKAGIQVTAFEKYAKGTKDFAILLQKAQASGAEAFYSPSNDGDLISMVRQMKERDINFKMTYMVYGSAPPVIEMGKDSQFLYSHTQFDPSVKWKVTDGLDTDGFLAAYKRLFPNAVSGADFQTALAYGAAVVLEKSIATANSLDAAKLKQAALDISGKTTMVSGQFEIDKTGFQTGMKPIVLQTQPEGMKIVAPEAIATGKPVFPVPAWSKR
ncbi:MAG: amino acid ABC transporter substrate-binding protein [Gammaproteobacteria bacterium]|nr:amino acid ABC transporter substrate-binding protein [Gammaproteobacteria bacterium]MBU1442152.1 amino acid ABC transporter substrate-binding protein [Gammaproteobacteria bacterium]MBU2285222.1 amino acid ABC transporter substrate-binding protein [Gammaproteobacteria bacterium]MBU2410842.1 amino acid ABC transporter substrate-binding protein [Gammaproteobacteria bacterium]